MPDAARSRATTPVDFHDLGSALTLQRLSLAPICNPAGIKDRCGGQRAGECRLPNRETKGWPAETFSLPRPPQFQLPAQLKRRKTHHRTAKDRCSLLLVRKFKFGYLPQPFL